MSGFFLQDDEDYQTKETGTGKLQRLRNLSIALCRKDLSKVIYTFRVLDLDSSLKFSVAQFFYKESVEEATLDWFTIEEVSQKRKIIATIIEKLAQDNLKDSSQLLPSINFAASAPVTRSRRRKPCYKESLTEEDDDFCNDADTDFTFAAAGFYGERSGLRSKTRAATVDITDDQDTVEKYQDHRDIVEDNQSRQKQRDRDLRLRRVEERKVGRFWKTCAIL